MGKRMIRAGTIAAAAFVSAFTGAGVASADAGTVGSDLADVSSTDLAQVRAESNSVLANSVARAIAEAGSESGIFGGFNSAPPMNIQL